MGNEEPGGDGFCLFHRGNNLTPVYKAILPATGTALPLAVADQFMTHTLTFTPIMRLPVILAVFASSFIVVSRKLSIFRDQDFEILVSAVPSTLRRHVRIFQHLVV